MMRPPRNAPTGMADQASTPAMLITRPSRWLGTIACRKLLVLILKRTPKPETTDQITTATQYQGVNANTTVSSPSSISAPNATLLKDQRLRRGPASCDSTTMPRLPADYMTPLSALVARNCTLANSTSGALTVAATKLTSAIMAEILRKTG